MPCANPSAPGRKFSLFWGDPAFTDAIAKEARRDLRARQPERMLT